MIYVALPLKTIQVLILELADFVWGSHCFSTSTVSKAGRIGDKHLFPKQCEHTRGSYGSRKGPLCKDHCTAMDSPTRLVQAHLHSRGIETENLFRWGPRHRCSSNDQMADTEVGGANDRDRCGGQGDIVALRLAQTGGVVMCGVLSKLRFC